MSTRFTNSVLQKGKIYTGSSATLNLSYGGQNGFLPRIGIVDGSGKSYGEWISNHAYLKHNLIPIVLQTPRFFNYLPEPEKWRRFYKALLETHALTIDGLTSTLTVETDEHAIGGAGEFQEEITDVKRSRSNPQFTFKEKAGRAVNKFWEAYIKYGMMDPDTKTPNIVKYLKDIGDIGGMYTPDFYSGTMIFIEPDITKMDVVDAWLCTNMFPKGAGDRTGKMEKTAGAEMQDVSIEFSAITLANEPVQKLAMSILGNLSVLKQIADQDLVLPVNGIAPEDNVQGEHGTNAGYNRENGEISGKSI